MPAPFAPLIGFLIGVGFHYSGSRQLSRAAPGTAVEARAVLFAIAYSLLVFAPYNAYFLATAPDWSLLYTVRSPSTGSALALALLLLDAASPPVGFIFARRVFKERRTASLARLVAPTVALVVLFVTLALRRLKTDATYDQYHGDFGVTPTMGGPLGYALVSFGIIFVLATVWASLKFRHLGE